MEPGLSYISKIEILDPLTLKPNEDNPRIITKEAFNKLKKSLEAFPNLLHIRPLVIDKERRILGGNMRHKAALELKFKGIPVIRADKLKPEEIEAFILLDNSPFGAWDYETLGNFYEPRLLENFNIQIPKMDLFGEDEDETPKAKKRTLLICPHCGEEFEK